MFTVLRLQGVPENICRIIYNMYEQNAKVTIRLGEGKHAPTFRQRSGIRQGSALSPLLFAICVDWALAQFIATMVEEQKWTREQAEAQALAWLGYVDDLVVKDSNAKDLEFALQELSSACRFIGLELNTKKTKVLAVNPEVEERKNPSAKMERCQHDGDWGWVIEWSGKDWNNQWKEEAGRLKMAGLGDLAPTHLVVWDTPSRGVTAVTLKQSGWALTNEGESIRLMRLGQIRHVIADKNAHECPKCGDILPDATALHFHTATGFCRPNKTMQELRTLRIGRQVEQKNKQAQKPTAVQEGKPVRHLGKAIEQVASFKYLGTEIALDGSTDAETTRRCAIALGVVQQLSPIWRDKTIPLYLKSDLFRSLSLSVAMYNSECWAISSAAATQLRRYQDSALRHVLGGHYKNQEKNRLQLCTDLGVQPLEVEVATRRLGWVAHTCRGDEAEGSVSRIEKELFCKSIWGRQLEDDFYMFGLTMQTLKETKPTAVALRATLAKRKPVKPIKKQRGAVAGRPKTEKRTAMEEERQRRLEQQRRETDEANKKLLSQINGKVWEKQSRSKYNFSVLADSGERISFRVTSFFFCEIAGMEEATVLGHTFQQNNATKAWTAANPIV
ncbi:unnamed protein product [Amoebophrya sp. A120]|nr:unnamed protein product [Amoebophrya sp. A120]|eukprot:GSA120T00014748001.1